MSNEKKNINEKVLTRTQLKKNPDLKLVPAIRDNPFKKSNKLVRSPPKINISEITTEALQANTSSNNYEEITDSHTETSLLNTSRKLEVNLSNIEEDQIASPRTQINDTFGSIFNKTVEPSDRYSDFGGIRGEQSLLLDFELKPLSPNNIQTFDPLLIDENSNTNKNNMENEQKPLRLGLKDVAGLVPDFDGKNISVNEYIEKLNHAKDIVSGIDEGRLVPILKIKLRGDVYRALNNVKLNNITEFIQAIRQLYPSTENIHTLYGKLTEIIQQPNESVLSFGNRIQDMVLQIKELKRAEPNLSAQAKTNFEQEINENAKASFRKGLKQEIRLELGDCADLGTGIQKAIAIEYGLKKQNSLRDSGVNIFCASTPFKEQTAYIHSCQICQDYNHEALFCDKAACVYCKNENHLSYNCKYVKNRIELVCKFCNAPGHSIDACKMNRAKGNHCQYCQVMGHTVIQCPFIIDYEVCWKCKGSGHDPNTCSNLSKLGESCEFCDSHTHTIRNCPSVLCKRCNQLGHPLKYCSMTNNRIPRLFCGICNDQNHISDDCELAKILVSQTKESKVNSSYNKYQSTNNEKRDSMGTGQNRFCEYCKMNNHTIDYCKKLKNLETNVNKKDKCAYCKLDGHKIENCSKLQALENQMEKFCSFCKQNNHTIDECFRRKKSGNE